MINDKEVTYFSQFASARNVFTAQDLFAKMEKEPEKEREHIDEILNFIATDIYNNQFTVDDILDGTDSADFMDMIQTQLIMVMTRDVEATKKQAFLNQN